MSARATRRLLGAAALLLAGAAAADLFSPGELAPPHKELEGLSQCTKCHPAGAQLGQQECLACHAEIEPGLKTRHGLHGRLSSEQRPCEHCHHEHQGAATDLAGWGALGMKGFEHSRTGYDLRGGHRKIECTACHERRLIAWAPALKLLAKRKTMLGVQKECAGCHFDEHRGQEKDECSKCHDEAKWKPAPHFDHNDTRYALKGKHQKVACDKCHSTERDDAPHDFPAPKHETYLKLKDIPFDTCNTCHRDVHAGKFGPRCETCHTVNSWTQIRTRDRAFHDKTRYPLEGAHLDVECEDCHGPWPGQKAIFKNMQFDQCTDCHPDGHEGQLLTNGKMPDCKECHTLETFLPVQFGRLAHGRTRFPLEGAHKVVPCDECHSPTPALLQKVPPQLTQDLKRKHRKELFSQALFDFPSATDVCDACHVDVHDGQFAESKKACTKCHGANSFTQLTFDHDKDSRYPLTGKHAKVACEKCHFPPADAPKGPDGVPVVRYRPLEQACSACHDDVHVGQLSKNKGEVAKCEDCHDTGDWHRTKFRHEPPFTTYRLDGAHLKVACEKCHPKVKLNAKLSSARYTPLPRTCAGCHTDFHKGEFEGFAP